MKKPIKIFTGLSLTLSLVLSACGFSGDKSSKTDTGNSIKNSNTQVTKSNESNTNKESAGQAVKNSTSEEKTKQTNKSEEKASVKESEKSSKVIYSNEAKYLAITEDMKMEKYMPPSEMLPQIAITYTVKNIKAKDFLGKYEKLLHTDGWKTVLDKKPENIMVEKDEHQAAIILQQVDKDLNILIMTQ